MLIYDTQSAGMREWSGGNEKKIGTSGIEKEMAILYSLFYSVLMSSYHAYKFS